MLLRLRYYLLVVFLLMPCFSGESLPPIKAVRLLDRQMWVNSITLELCAVLEEQKDRICQHLDVDGNPTGQSFFLTTHFLWSVVDNEYSAAVLNPSWGKDREECTIRHLCSQYRETDWDQNALHLNRKWGTYDRGIEQTNDCHLVKIGKWSEWQRFCWLEKMGTDDPKLLFDPRINARFAAHLNEMFCIYHKRTYTYNKTLKQKELYARLEAVSKAQHRLIAEMN